MTTIGSSLGAVGSLWESQLGGDLSLHGTCHSTLGSKYSLCCRWGTAVALGCCLSFWSSLSILFTFPWTLLLNNICGVYGEFLFQECFMPLLQWLQSFSLTSVSFPSTWAKCWVLVMWSLSLNVLSMIGRMALLVLPARFAKMDQGPDHDGPSGRQGSLKKDTSSTH